MISKLKYLTLFCPNFLRPQNQWNYWLDSRTNIFKKRGQMVRLLSLWCWPLIISLLVPELQHPYFLHQKLKFGNLQSLLKMALRSICDVSWKKCICSHWQQESKLRCSWTVNLVQRCQQIMNLEIPNELRQYFHEQYFIRTLSWYVCIVDANKGNYKPPTLSTNKEFRIPYLLTRQYFEHGILTRKDRSTLVNLTLATNKESGIA